MENRKLLNEFIPLIIASLWFFFTSTNINPTLGTVYGGLVALGFFIPLIDQFFGKKDIQLFNPNVNWGTRISVALVGYILVIAFSYFAQSISQIIPIGELLSSLAASSPVFSNSPILNFITFSDIISYLESIVLFVYLVDFLFTVFKLEIRKESLFNYKSWIIISFISIIFMLFHSTAKSLNSASLLIVLFMAIISIIVSIIWRDGATTTLVHVILNTWGAIYLLSPITNKLIIPILFNTTI